MKTSQKWIFGIGTSLSLVIAATAAYAHPGQMGSGSGAGMQHGMSGGMGHDAMGHKAKGRTLEERTALHEKMRNAKTPEERQQIASEARAAMQKRAHEKGNTAPEHHGMHGGKGNGPNATPATPIAPEHKH
jgi:hypothetical protein